MDLIRQNKFIGWVIAILVLLNLLSLSTIWIQSSRNNPPPARVPGNPQAGSLPLLQRELGLTPDQTKRFEEMRKTYQESSKPINDELDGMKLSLTDEIFKSNPDQQRIDSMASKIGAQQSKLEVLRFNHFAQLAQICDSVQKEKLYPILREVFGRKGPAEQAPARSDQEKPRQSRKVEKGAREERSPQSVERPGPPSQEEKLNRYTQRLSLTPDQVRKVGDILMSTRSKEDAFKLKTKPSEPDFERAKQRIRDEEDRNIMQVLNPTQKREFEKMLENRNKQPRR
jgi:Spy/CpxP family protein refolding chaperone